MPTTTLRNPIVADSDVQRNFEGLLLFLNEFAGFFYWGEGSPENVVTASPPAVYLNLSGGAGTTIYSKESGVDTDTGWVGK